MNRSVGPIGFNLITALHYQRLFKTFPTHFAMLHASFDKIPLKMAGIIETNRIIITIIHYPLPTAL